MTKGRYGGAVGVSNAASPLRAGKILTAGYYAERAKEAEGLGARSMQIKRKGCRLTDEQILLAGNILWLKDVGGVSTAAMIAVFGLSRTWINSVLYGGTSKFAFPTKPTEDILNKFK